jgi:hypothetical protein
LSELAIREAHGIEVPGYRPAQVAERDIVDGWIKVATDISNLANFIAETDFVPKALRNKPAAVAACILTGRELGIGPMQSLKSIHMVQGTPGLSAEFKRARALEAGHDIVFDETNSSRCIVRGRRKGTDRWVTVTWTMDMAKRAKLSGRDVWQQYPQRMLQARASSELCDILFPDASLGLATTEVLEDGGIITADGQVVDAATGEIATGAPDGKPAAIEPARPRTAQRKSRTEPRPAAARAASGPAPATAPAPARTAPSAGSGELPPLPGEEEDPTTSGASSSANAPDSGSPSTSAAPSSDSSGTSAPDETDYDTPGTVSPAQLTRIWATLKSDFEYTDAEREAARETCALIIRRDIASSKELSFNEAKGVIDAFGHFKHLAEAQGGGPRDYLMAAMQAAEEGQASGGE